MRKLQGLLALDNTGYGRFLQRIGLSQVGEGTSYLRVLPCRQTRSEVRRQIVNQIVMLEKTVLYRRKSNVRLYA
jgi:hypothetical protein